MLLSELAHSRTGDKGNTSQISVIAYDPADYALIESVVTGERVLAHLAALRATSIKRYELPQLGALNFVLTDALGGGVTRSLSLDAHGKSLGAQLLDLDLGDQSRDAGA